VLTKHSKEPVLIVSGDKDFLQLQKYDYVKQWSPNLNKFVDCVEPDVFLKEHILKGDKSDGIPNILSNDDCLDLGIRQTPLRKPVLEKYLRISIENDDKYYRNYLRNQNLIDLDMIPDKIEDAILGEYSQTEPVKGKVFDYLRTHRLNQLLDNIGDFSL
jgi:5'-3' exonuclease